MPLKAGYRGQIIKLLIQRLVQTDPIFLTVSSSEAKWTQITSKHLVNLDQMLSCRYVIG